MIMKESMMRNLVFVNTLMNKLLIIPMFFLTMCGTAPVTPPAQACSPRLDGKPTYCPPPDSGPMFPKPLIPKKQVKGEVDIYNPYHWNTLHGVFIENLRRKRIEENMTPPSDAINSALEQFWEVQDGSNGSTEQEELL